MANALAQQPCAKMAGNEETPKKILFVCTGNTCRSPMAAAMLGHLAEGAGDQSVVQATSAGLHAVPGAPISAHAAAALEKAGVCAARYAAHRACPVDAAMVAEADEVVGMTAAHAMELMLRFPEAASKIKTLPMDIADPYGGSAQVYEDCLAQLQYCLQLAYFGGER